MGNSISFFVPMELINGIFLAMIAVVPVVALVITRRPDWGANRAAQASLRAQLPLGSETTERSIRFRTRAILRANMWGLLVIVAAMAMLFGFSQLGATPYFLWVFTTVVLFGVLSISTVVANTRERLFSPAPAAPRVARPRALSVRDYIGLWRLRIPRLILVGAGVLSVGVVVTVSVGWTAPQQLVWLSLFALLAVAATVAARWAERRILAQPQPASDTLELAWDDLFRADSLTTLRMATAMAAWLPLGLAASILLRAGLPFDSSGWEATLGLFPWWGIPVLQLAYTLGLGKLPSLLYPEFLRVSAVASPVIGPQHV